MKKKKLKICYLGDAKSQHLASWSKGFTKLGHEVHVISPNNAEINGVRVHPTKTKYNKYFNFFLTYIKIRKLIKKINPDIVHAHFLGKYSFLGSLSGFHPFMGTIWGSDVSLFAKKNKITNLMFNHILKKSDVIEVFDNATIKFLKKNYNLEDKKIYNLYWGINPDEFKKTKSRKIQIAYLRKASKKYSTSVFIDALKLVKKEFPNINSTLMKGDINSKNLLKENKLEKNIKILDWMSHSDISGLLNSSILYVDSFHRNFPGSGIGITTMEAMVCGLPVVLADNPGVRDYIKDNYNGLIYEQGNPKELAKCIIKLLKDKKLREKLGGNARKTILNELNWNKNSLKIEKKYFELVNGV